jgi:hypothetical protein
LSYRAVGLEQRVLGYTAEEAAGAGESDAACSPSRREGRGRVLELGWKGSKQQQHSTRFKTVELTHFLALLQLILSIRI